MASLALLVALIFLTVLTSGPFLYCLSFISIVPNWLIWFLCVPVTLIGIWWLSVVPTFPVNFIGIFPILFCYWSVQRRRRK
jgi:hypothetical protein